jgi:hypothetical protein
LENNYLFAYPKRVHIAEKQTIFLPMQPEKERVFLFPKAAGGYSSLARE